nr:hypothetical protein Q903MT_gene2308 [Picea sitchensis]
MYLLSMRRFLAPGYQALAVLIHIRDRALAVLIMGASGIDQSKLNNKR